MPSLFAAVEMAPRDPILGLNEHFNADPNPAKVNLGVGVYYDDDGKLPLLKCVAAAERQMVEALQALNGAAAGTLVVLHACCHNPTGYDITHDQWQQVIAAVKSRGLVAFLDMAYQGFGDGIAEDGAVIGLFMAAGLDFFVATSFS